MRKINEKLIERLLDEKDLKPLLECIKTDKELRLEVRIGGKFMVYYKKCKALEVGLKSYNVDPKYFCVECEKISKEEIKKMCEKEPKKYFEKIKKIIDCWRKAKRVKEEFVAQQKIASENQFLHQNYYVLDMEYNLSQAEISENNREKRNGYDLVAIENKTKQIVLFEVKKGTGALSGKAGIRKHIEDFEQNFTSGDNREKFKTQLFDDIENSIADKKN